MTGDKYGWQVKVVTDYDSSRLIKSNLVIFASSAF